MKDIRNKVKNLRRDFNFDTLSEDKAPENPLDLLHQWLNDAIENGLKDPNAFVLATVKNGQPDSRVVLLRDASEEGLQFFTNYSSKKGEDLVRNNRISANFFWVELDRQIRIHAKVSKLSPDQSDEYFASRPRGSQIGAWASSQSHSLKSRKTLEKRIKELESRFEGQDVPRPEFWGGYLLEPHYYEFWQGRESRLHDRICYEQEADKWSIQRLFP
ncbi:MAG: pyridoxamine 5'-phosphate oxidase [Vicingaceae bacterium]